MKILYYKHNKPKISNKSKINFLTAIFLIGFLQITI